MHPLQGALLFAFGLLLFAGMDTTTKFLAERYDVPLIIAVRYIVNCLLMVVLLAPRHGRKLIETQRTGLAILRAVALAAASLLIGFALQRMPVAETTAIIFIAPMVVVLLAGPLLKERIGARAWTAAILGFGGMLLIVRPGGGLDPVGVACALAAIGAGVTYQLLSGALAATERTIALLFYTALVGSIGFGLALPWFWHGELPGTLEILLFLSTGIYAGVGHFLFTAAYRDAPASVLAPMNYIQLIWAGLLGWLVFGDLPDGLSILGMGVIAASGVMIALRPREVRQSGEEAQGRRSRLG